MPSVKGLCARAVDRMCRGPCLVSQNEFESYMCDGPSMTEVTATKEEMME